MRRVQWIGGLLVLAISGCIFTDDGLSVVSPNPFEAPSVSQVARPVPQAKASEEAAMRVSLVGQKILAANPQTALRPVFQTVGVQEPEIFHRGTQELYITEGLTRQCKSEGQLAAVLAVELGKMVSEREALAGPAIRAPDRLPPQEVRVGADAGGTFGAPDATRLAELTKFEREHRQPKTLQPPDPLALAKIYLEKAGYTAADLESATFLLKAAHANATVEKQLHNAAIVRPWAR